MFKLSDKNTAFFDVDDTLVLWSSKYRDIDPPIEFPVPEKHQERLQSRTVKCIPHRPHIEQLLRHAARGHNVVVWSAGGADWAETVVQMLGLEGIVDVCMSKPEWYYDDLQHHEVLPKSDRIYLSPRSKNYA